MQSGDLCEEEERVVRRSISRAQLRGIRTRVDGLLRHLNRGPGTGTETRSPGPGTDVKGRGTGSSA